MSAPELERAARPTHARTAALYRDWAREAAMGLESLSPAMASAASPASPQLARAAQATENAWREIDAEFGLLSAGEVATKLGYRGNRSWASVQRKAGRLLAVRRGGAYRYPGFQAWHGVLDVITELVKIGRADDWTDESIILWLCSPSGSMPADARPVDFLVGSPQLVVQGASQVMAGQW